MQRILAGFLTLLLAVVALVTICEQMSIMHVIDSFMISFDHMDGKMNMAESSSPGHMQSFWKLVPGSIPLIDLLSFALILGAFFFVVFSVRLSSREGVHLLKQRLRRWMYFESFPGLVFAFQSGILHPKRF